MSSYNPAPATVYGRTENRLKALKVLHVPLKTSNIVDSVDTSPQLFIVGTALRYYVNGAFYEVGGSGAVSGRFGIEDALGEQDRSIDMEQHMFGTTNANVLSYQTRKPGATSADDIFFGWYSDNAYSGLYASQGTAPDDSLMGIRMYPDKATINVRGTASPYPNGDWNIPVSVDGVFANTVGNIVLNTNLAAKMAAVTTTTALSALSGATYNFAILNNTSDNFVGYSGLYGYNALAGDFTATGGGFWKKLIVGLVDEQPKNTAEAHYEMQKTLVIYNNKASGYSHTYDSSKPPMMLVLKNDETELTNYLWGGMICSSANGGAINFKSRFNDTNFGRIEIGLVDNDYIFTNMLEFNRLSGTPTGLLRVNLTPATNNTQTLGTTALLFNKIFVTGARLGITSATAPIGSASNFLGVDVNGDVGYYTTPSGGGGGGWGLTGNAGTNPATNYIGTSDAQKLIFKVNGALSGVLDSAQTSVAFGLGAFASLAGIGIVAIGTNALAVNDGVTGSFNTAIGHNALAANTAGSSNVAVGGGALQTLTTGISCTAVGAGALNLATGGGNSAVGTNAAKNVSTGVLNVAMGQNCLQNINTGGSNVGIGYDAGAGATSGSNNVWIGAGSFSAGVTGSNNTSLGYQAKFTGAIGNSIALGAGAISTASFQFFLASNITSFAFPFTATPAGTVGAQTISKPFGTVNFAAGATTLVVTNAAATTTSKIFVQVCGTDTTALYARVTRANGSFTITLNAAATAETAVAFFIVV